MIPVADAGGLVKRIKPNLLATTAWLIARDEKCALAGLYPIFGWQGER